MKVYLLWHRTWNDNDESIVELDSIYHSKLSAENVRLKTWNPNSYFIEEWEVK